MRQSMARPARRGSAGSARLGRLAARPARGSAGSRLCRLAARSARSARSARGSRLAARSSNAPVGAQLERYCLHTLTNFSESNFSDVRPVYIRGPSPRGPTTRELGNFPKSPSSRNSGIWELGNPGTFPSSSQPGIREFGIGIRERWESSRVPKFPEFGNSGTPIGKSGTFPNSRIPEFSGGHFL